MIDYLFTKTFPAIKDWQMKLLVVDDTSPDSTYKVVQQKQNKYQDLSLSFKRKSGAWRRLCTRLQIRHERTESGCGHRI